VSTNTVAAVFHIVCISSLPQIVDVIIDGIRAIVVIAKNLTKLISVDEICAIIYKKHNDKKMKAA